MRPAPLYVTDALDLVEVFERATHVDEVFHRLTSWLAQFGASAFLVTGLPAPSDSHLEPYILLNGWPRLWHQRYMTANLYRYDPCVRHCLTQREPFLWSELPAPVLSGPEPRRVMHEAAEFGLTEGLCIPLHDPMGFHGVLTTAGPTFRIPQRARWMAQILAHYAYGAAARIHCRGVVDARQTLTGRERDVLRWAGLGKSAWDTGVILGLSTSTVEKHLGSARTKLGAITTTQAVVEALRRNLIQF